jgi:hypothetical protein
MSTEDLVEVCYVSVPYIYFQRALPSSPMDGEGIDFVVGWNSRCGPEVKVQVKTSRDGDTIGFVIPEEIKNKKDINKLRGRVPYWMFRRIKTHFGKHPDIRHMLFVPRPSETTDSVDKIIEKIWRVTVVKLLPVVPN